MLLAVKLQPNWLVCTLQPRKQDPGKQSVIVCKHKEYIMASCAAQSVMASELLGDELFEDYFDETTNLSSSASATNATELKTASNEDLERLISNNTENKNIKKKKHLSNVGE